MELTSVSVEKKSVVLITKDEWNITMTLTGYNTTVTQVESTVYNEVWNEDTQEMEIVPETVMVDEDVVTKLFTKDFGEAYRKGDNVNVVLAGFREQMQLFIDKWVSENSIFNSPALDSAVSTIQDNLDI